MATTTGTFQWFDDGPQNAAGIIHGSETDIRVLLLKSSYTWDATDTVVNDLTPGSNEVTTGGYARYALTSEAVSEPTTATYMFDSEDPTWTASGTNLVARRWVLYIYNASDASAKLVCSGLLDNADADVTTTVGDDLTHIVDANGWFRLSGTT